MIITPQRSWTAALATIFFAAHLVFLPSTLEDIDSLNFALGIHDFDPARHQPHPPGYPIFIALAKISRAVTPSDAQALALLGALFGALALFPLMKLYQDMETLGGRNSAAALSTSSLATLMVATSPLYWFNAQRPMSDVPGLALILGAQAALASAFVRQRLNPPRTPEALAESGRMIVLGAFLSALAIGIRSQALWLTLPLLGLVLVQRAGRGAAGAVLGSAMAFTIGVLLWFVPLVFASGGPASYLRVISAQGGEDLAGVDMLYLNPSVRRLAFNLLETFIYPWSSSSLGWLVFALAFAGAIVVLRREPRLALLLAVLSGPYLAVHLLLQETVTMRYALPLIPALAYLAVRGVQGILAMIRLSGAALQLGTTLTTAVVVVWSLAVTLPAVRVYAREGTPAFAAIADMRQRLAAEPGVIGLHQGLARSVQTQNFGDLRVLGAPPMREWLEVTKYWREGNTAPVWFLADPARTDIELIDPLSRKIQGHFLWGFPRLRFMGGARPDIVDLVRIDSPPGWFAEQGWHLTPETLNMSERRGLNQAVAYAKTRTGPALMILGAESTGATADVVVSIDDREIRRWNVPTGTRVFDRVVLAPGSLSNGGALSRLVASYAAPDGRPLKVRLTEFAVAPPEAIFAVQHAGWNEIEYSKELQRRWRWTTARAQTFVNSGGKDVTMRLSGESPLRYFDAPPRVTVRAGSQVLATAQPADDFELTVNIPAGVLAAADGTVTIETDRTFVPSERSGGPDRRTLGLRIFDLAVR